MLSPYKINPNNTNKQQKKTSNTNSSNDLHHDPDHKRPQRTSNDLKRPQLTSNKNGKKVKTKNNLKGGFVQKNNESNEHYLDQILRKNNPQMELARQNNSNDKTVRNDTIRDLKEFNQQSVTTQAKKGEQLVSMMPAIKKLLI